MREKYIEEAFPRYFIFGGPGEEGLVDVAVATDSWHGAKTFPPCGDVLTNVKHEEAKALIAEHNRLVDALVYAINAHGEENDKDYEVFKKVAYGEG